MNQVWINQYWRAFISWSYGIVCLFDFMIAPILTLIFFTITKQPYVPWTPITLQGGGFYHISMGSINGVSAWQKGQETIASIQNPTMTTQTGKTIT